MQTKKPRCDAVFKSFKSGGYYFRLHIQTTNCGRRPIHTDQVSCLQLHRIAAVPSHNIVVASLSLSLLPPSLFPPSPSIKFESRVKHVLHNFVIPSPTDRPTKFPADGKERCSLPPPFDIGRWRRKHDSPFSPLLSGVVGVVRRACGCYAV